MNELPTPRTDAEIEEICNRHPESDGIDFQELGDFAKKLEREITTLQQELAEARREIERAKADRNRSGMVERRKYLPKISEIAQERDTLRQQLREATFKRDLATGYYEKLTKVCIEVIGSKRLAELDKEADEKVGEDAVGVTDIFEAGLVELRTQNDRLREALSLVYKTDLAAVAELKQLGLDSLISSTVMDKVKEALSQP